MFAFLVAYDEALVCVPPPSLPFPFPPFSFAFRRSLTFSSSPSAYGSFLLQPSTSLLRAYSIVPSLVVQHEDDIGGNSDVQDGGMKNPNRDAGEGLWEGVLSGHGSGKESSSGLRMKREG